MEVAIPTKRFTLHKLNNIIPGEQDFRACFILFLERVIKAKKFNMVTMNDNIQLKITTP